MNEILENVHQDERGAVGAEYAVLLIVMVAAVALGTAAIAGPLQGHFSQILQWF